MNPIKLEIFLDDKTLAGMRSEEGNVVNMEAFTRRMIGHLKLELKDLCLLYTSTKETMNADFKAIALKLGLPETATETEILARIGILQGHQDVYKRQRIIS